MKNHERSGMVGIFAAAMLVVPALAGAAINLNESRDTIFSEFELGPELSYIKYEEPDIMEEKGVMGGVFGAWTARTPQNVVLGIDGRLSFGQLDYDSGSTGSV